MKYDIVVVGGGHAGIEASLASARMGKKTLLITILAEQIGAASCNPAIGGLAKGHLVKEIDALGGQMGLTTDKTGIQFRILNESKGPAVRGSRAQIDMDRYRIYMRNIILNTENLTVAQEMVDDIVVENGEIKGVITHLKNHYEAKKVIITAGTFLKGLIHIGEFKQHAGRAGEFASEKLSESLKEHGFKLGRLKTGTCARLDAKSIDFTQMEAQSGDDNPVPFSFRTDKENFNPTQLPCYVTYTNEDTHNIIRSNFDRAPLFTGQIHGIGPRYCPSIEDKINRFSDKLRHHLFIEPQTKEANEYYINGLTTSLPPDVQVEMIHSIKGLENARLVRHGYAIEYDFHDPTMLYHTLETKEVKGLYFAGQINATTGYEEAAAQGLMAGINASLSIDEKEPLIFRRDEAYIGVLIDDLVTKGTSEPYRMFTSRAEYRLLLREDNADLRLSKYGYGLGLIGVETHEKVLKLSREIKSASELLETKTMTPTKENQALLATLGTDGIKERVELRKIVARKEFTLESLVLLVPEFEALSQRVKEQVLIGAKYHSYIKKQQEQIEKMKTLLNVKIPDDFSYDISGLSNEVQEKLKKHNPQTLHAASNISGVTPAAIDILHVYIKMGSKGK